MDHIEPKDSSSSTQKTSSSLIKLNLFPIDKNMFVPLSEVEVEKDELIKDVYKVHEYDPTIKDIIKSIDEYYQEIDNFR